MALHPLRYLLRLVPEREHFLPAIQAQLPELEIIRDTKRDAMHTFLCALEAAGPDAVVHLEDDITLTRQFRIKLETVVKLMAKPCVIQFFSLRTARPSCWMPGATFLMAQCFYMPAGYSQALLEYAPLWPLHSAEPTGLDLMTAHWLKSRGERYWLAMPSLVQHNEVRSVIAARRSSRRISPTFKP